MEFQQASKLICEKQRVWESMLMVNHNANTSWRLPYWDWGATSFQMPPALTQSHWSGLNNPLQGFANQITLFDRSPAPMGSDYMIGKDGVFYGVADSPDILVIHPSPLQLKLTWNSGQKQEQPADIHRYKTYKLAIPVSTIGKPSTTLSELQSNTRWIPEGPISCPMLWVVC